MIKTTINVTCSENNTIVPYTGKVVGKILAAPIIFTNGVATGIAVNFVYEKEAGGQLFSDVEPTKTTEEINQFYVAIEPTLPTFVDFMSNLNNILYAAFKVEMAAKFGILTSEIENI